MKLITLNIWGGHLRNPLLKFIHEHRDVDIFCLQEVYYNAHRTIVDKERELSLNIFSDLKKLLPEHYSGPHCQDSDPFNLRYNFNSTFFR
ncbi:hypothetical protein TUM19329_19700 [Legionella antarctica]|uniref:Endonuclease/exonuclease/phosphatase domain-containing protein n=1 Tax=Legionella antarctica TaxID=2708020 RepID=A0A6F8T584_9GAMM|nr:hypothetical protein TUM19329_19700 [Legionella antarctica]